MERTRTKLNNKPLYQNNEIVRTRELKRFEIIESQEDFHGIKYRGRSGINKELIHQKEIIRLIYPLTLEEEYLLARIDWCLVNSSNAQLIQLLLDIVFKEAKYSNLQDRNYHNFKDKVRYLRQKLFLSYCLVVLLLCLSSYALISLFYGS